ncbi:hypothetical protein ACFY3G_02700 [Streptomyces phaeochromogenes]|uniref:hypothetical protein n=1 Tax=Streptomyces phaeochromogenes TaxID=1923 RepID=UPI0036B022EF
MADGNTTSSVDCPICSEPVPFPVTITHRSNLRVGVAVDLAPVREHMATHQAPSFTTELPPTDR